MVRTRTLAAGAVVSDASEHGPLPATARGRSDALWVDTGQGRSPNEIHIKLHSKDGNSKGPTRAAGDRDGPRDEPIQRVAEVVVEALESDRDGHDREAAKRRPDARVTGHVVGQVHA